jgi:hypothetical protein
MLDELGIYDSKENIVKLTPREHKFVHRVLAKAFPCHPIRNAYNMRYTTKLVVAYDKHLEMNTRVSLDEYYGDRERYSHPSAGKTDVYSPSGERIRILSSEMSHYESLGYRHFLYGKGKSDEMKEKLRLANLGKKHSEETKEKLRKCNSGRPGRPTSVEAREKLRLANLGKKHSEETKEKLRKCNSGRPGRPTSVEAREKLRLANLGKKHSEGTKEKLSESHTGYKWTQESLQKVSETRKRLIWINNGTSNKRILPERISEYPDYVLGRCKRCD